MNQTEILQAEIKRFIAIPNPEVLCISGEWGIGKTFTWQKLLDEASAEKKVGVTKYSYVSLFGISTLDGLKMAIFENTRSFVDDTSDDLKEKGKSYGEQLFGFFKKNRQIAEALPFGLGAALSKAGPLYFSTVKEQLVCIDDLERRSASLTVKDVLGLISFLKEQRQCKVVLLLNDKELGADGTAEFTEYAEKVIDVELRFAPTPEDSVRIALSRDDRISKSLGKHCISLGISNIRVIKKIERFVREVDPHLTNFDVDVFNQAAATITLLGWAKFQPRAAPSLDFIRKLSIKEYFSLGAETSLTPDESKWKAVLDDFGFRWMDDFDYALLRAIEVGYFDRDELVRTAEPLNKQIAINRDNMSFEAAWDGFHDSFSNDPEQVLNNIAEAFKRSVHTVSPVNLNGTVGLFREVGRNEVADKLIDYYVSTRNEKREFWDLDDYAFGDDVTDQSIRQAFSQKLASLVEEFSPADTLIKIGTDKSWGQRDLDGLATLPVEDFYRTFKAADGKALRKIVRGALMFKSVSNASPQMLEISQRAEEALRVIARESALNARRVAKYGVTVEPPAEAPEEPEDAV